MTKRVGIIWWWAAGMMVAATIIEIDPTIEVHIFEKNKELWTKVKISWWWRCNVTTWFYKKQDLQKKYTRWRDFLSHAMAQFGPRKMAMRCEEHWVPLTCEEDMRVFPSSNIWSDIVRMFESILHTWHVTIHFEEWVTALQKQADWYTITTWKKSYIFDNIVLTTWWNAYAHTGSSGDWYAFATMMWHTVTELWPSLNSFLIHEERIMKCSWIAFQTAKITDATIGVTWPLLMTHFGISWPVTFSYSSHIPYVDISHKKPHQIKIVPFADMNMQYWLEWLDNQGKNEPKKQLSTILHFIFTKRFVELFLEEYSINGTFMMSNVSREVRKKIASLLWEWFITTLLARRPGDEFVTAWWVVTADINYETMESKLSPWLYFAWEILNIDAVTGGFNFQSCWATWRAAGIAIAS